MRKIFLAQSYQNKSMLFVCTDGICPDFEEDENISFTIESSHQKTIDAFNNADYLAGLSMDDYYGKNYLMDLALATRYSDAEMITKGGCYAYDDNNGLQLEENYHPYKSTTSAAAQSSILYISEVSKFDIIDFAKAIGTENFMNDSIFVIDEFNYCKNGAESRLGIGEKARVDDLQNIDTGISINDKWIEKQIKMIEHEKEMKQKLVYRYKENIAQSKIQGDQIKIQDAMIKKKDAELIQLKSVLNSLITIPFLRHPIEKIKSYKKLIQVYQKLDNS